MRDLHISGNYGDTNGGPFRFDTNSGLILSNAPLDTVSAGPMAEHAYREAFPQLQLSLTYACNMECSYCSFRSRMDADGRPLNMKTKTALDAVDFFASDILGKTRHIRIDFGLTGETFLRHKIHRALKEAIRDKVNNLPLRSASVGPNTTNGTLSDIIDFEDTMGPPQDISCDGPREVHDATRPYIDGRGTYDDLEELIGHVLEKHPDIGATAVITSRFTDIKTVFLHLHDHLGFRSIYIKPVNLAPEEPDGLNPRTLKQFKTGYSDLTDFFISCAPDKKLQYLSSLYDEDFFMRYFYRVANRIRNNYRCGAGKSGAYVDTDGNLFPCAHFIGKKGYEIGNINDGYDEIRRDAYRQLTVDSREPCRSCWAKYVCGGGCYYQAAVTNNDITKPDETKCQLVMHLICEAIRLYLHLAEKHPQILAALPYMPTHIRSDARALSTDAVYRPVSALTEARCVTAKPVELLQAPHLLKALSRPDDDLSLSFAAQDNWLHLDFFGQNITLDTLDLWVIDLERDPVLMQDLPALSDDVFGTKLHWTKEKGFSQSFPSLDGAFREIPYRTRPQQSIPKDHASYRSDGMSFRFDLVECLQLSGCLIGLNLECRLADGRMVKLVRAEPFAQFDLTLDGPLDLHTPKWVTPTERDAINGSPFEGMVSMHEWRGLQQNVC